MVLKFMGMDKLTWREKRAALLLPPPLPNTIKLWFHTSGFGPHSTSSPPVLCTCSLSSHLDDHTSLLDWFSRPLLCSLSLMLPSCSNPCSKMPTSCFSKTVMWSCQFSASTAVKIDPNFLGWVKLYFGSVFCVRLPAYLSGSFLYELYFVLHIIIILSYS